MLHKRKSKRNKYIFAIRQKLQKFKISEKVKRKFRPEHVESGNAFTTHSQKANPNIWKNLAYRTHITFFSILQYLPTDWLYYCQTNLIIYTAAGVDGDWGIVSQFVLGGGGFRKGGALFPFFLRVALTCWREEPFWLIYQLVLL